jgi:hypothetical protein
MAPEGWTFIVSQDRALGKAEFHGAGLPRNEGQEPNAATMPQNSDLFMLDGEK